MEIGNVSSLFQKNKSFVRCALLWHIFKRTVWSEIPHLSSRPCNILSNLIGLCEVTHEVHGKICTFNLKNVFLAVLDDALQKVNTDPVCFQTKNELPGYFRMPKSGFVRRMELVHRSGQVYCSEEEPASFWGCAIRSYRDKKLQTLITFPNKTILLPPEGSLQREGACLSYGLSGVNHDSTELVFLPFIPAIPVSAGQKFYIWFEQDLNNCTEQNNSGETCADVFVRYA